MGNSLAPKGVFGAFDTSGFVIEEPQVVFYKAYQPDFIADLFDTDVLPGEDGT